MSEVKKNIVYGNKFYIMGNFKDDMIEEIIAPLNNKIIELQNQKNAEIELHISSNGGNYDMSWKIIDLIEQAKNNDIVVKTIVTYGAFSVGSMVAVTGTKGERYIARTAEHLIHYGTFNGHRHTTPLQQERTTEYFKRHLNNVESHYKKYANVPKLKEHIKDDDFYIPADKCIEWGLADKYTDELK